MEKDLTPLQVVEELNQRLYDRFKEETSYFSYSTDGYVESISFDDKVIWCSEWYEREFDEELNEYEPMLPFIVNQFQKYVTKLQRLSQLHDETI